MVRCIFPVMSPRYHTVAGILLAALLNQVALFQEPPANIQWDNRSVVQNVTRSGPRDRSFYIEGFVSEGKSNLFQRQGASRETHFSASICK